MKGSVWTKVGFTLLFFTSILIGCEKELKTVVITEKEQETLSAAEKEQEETKETGDILQETEDSLLLTVREQVQAPETADIEVSREKVTVDGTPAVEVPDTASIQRKKIQFRAFTWEEAEKIACRIQPEIDLNGSELLQNDATGGMEILLQGVCDTKEGSYHYTCYNDRECFYMSELKAAYYPEKEEGIWANILPADVSQAEKELDEEALITQGDAFVKDLGYEELNLSGWEYVESAAYAEERQEEDTDQTVYGMSLYYTRRVDEVPVSYVSLQGSSIEDAYGYTEEAWDSGEGKIEEQMWQPEGFFLMISPVYGILQANYVNPIAIQEEEGTDAFLLPFSQIQEIFQSLAGEETAAAAEAEEITSLHLEVTKIVLGYAQIHEKGDVTRGELVPVWDFYGTEELEIEYTDDKGEINKEVIGNHDAYQSLMTINAMDGTVIDRTLGY